MAKHAVDLAIIGAGPYGLSIAAHLNAAGVDCRVFGATMEGWSGHMPAGMHLKSDPIASSLFAPHGGLTLEDFCRERHIGYHHYCMPVRLEDFIAYGRAFQQRFVPQVEARRVLELAAHDQHFRLDFDRGESVAARRVVIAVGAMPFAQMPPMLRALPADLASHSGDYGPLERLQGRQVAILGAGASAIDLAALLGMRGGNVTLLARASHLHFQPTPTASTASRPRRAWRRIWAPASHGLGDGWLMRACADAPGLIHRLPDPIRGAILRNTLGPAGGHFIRDQLMRNTALRLGRTLEGVRASDGRVQLLIGAPDGTRETLSAEHVIAATGYRVDLRRVRFFDAPLLARLRTRDHVPALSADFESSVPGLYFAGLAAAGSFGPALRFVQGAGHPARRLAAHLPRALVRGQVSVPATLVNTPHTTA